MSSKYEIFIIGILVPVVAFVIIQIVGDNPLNTPELPYVINSLEKSALISSVVGEVISISLYDDEGLISKNGIQTYGIHKVRVNGSLSSEDFRIAWSSYDSENKVYIHKITIPQQSGKDLIIYQE